MKHLQTYESLAGQFYDIQAGMGLNKRNMKKKMSKIVKQMKKKTAPKTSKLTRFDEFSGPKK